MLVWALAWMGLGCTDGNPSETGDSGMTVPVPEDLDAVTSAVRPTKRSEIRAVAHTATNTILLFGGNDGPVVNQRATSRFLRETWVYEPGTGWTELDLDTRPRKRARYTIVVDEEGHRALLFGGRFRPDGNSGDYTLYNDLWAFDFLTRTWEQLDDGSGSAPAPRYYSQGAWDAANQTFYVWGGNLNTNGLDFGNIAEELWAWHDGTWTEIQTTGTAPSRRSFLDSAYDSQRNALVIFGGQRGDLYSQAYNDTFVLNLDNHRWRQVHDGSQSEAPSTRMHAPLLYDEARDRVILFGGHTDVGDQNDLWQFDLDSKTWSELRFADELHPEVGFGCAGIDSEVPAEYVTVDTTAPERRHNGMVTLMHENVWVFGGWHAECSDHLDDTWRFDLVNDTWHEIIEARAGESCERADEDCVCLCP